MTDSSIIHPAKFSRAVLDVVSQVFDEYLPEGGRILDPFAGIGGIHSLASESHTTIGTEIEAEWAKVHHRTIQADALCLPFGPGVFDAICTSPVYGNRLSDHHNAQDGSLRRSYTHDLRRMTGNQDRTLHSNNSGVLQWGDRYRSFHNEAWIESRRVLKPHGLMVLNVSDHVRKGEIQQVSDWHLSCLRELGFKELETRGVATPRMRNGANSLARVKEEIVAVLRRPRAN